MRSDKLRKIIWIRHKRVKYRRCLLLKMSIINHFDLIICFLLHVLCPELGIKVSAVIC